MYYGDRDELIEKVGIKVADEILSLRREVEALQEYLGVVKVYGTRGYRLVKEVVCPDAPTGPGLA